MVTLHHATAQDLLVRSVLPLDAHGQVLEHQSLLVHHHVLLSRNVVREEAVQGEPRGLVIDKGKELGPIDVS